MADITIPQGTGVIGQVALVDNKCYEIKAATTGPVTHPTVTSVHASCEECAQYIVKTCCANLATPASPDDCGIGCTSPPQKLYFEVTAAEGPWSSLVGHVFELVYGGFCYWYGSFSGCPAGFPYGTIEIALYDIGGDGYWIIDMYESTFTYFTYLENYNLDPCAPPGSYTCEPFCTPGESIAGTVSGDAGPCTP